MTFLKEITFSILMVGLSLGFITCQAQHNSTPPLTTEYLQVAAQLFVDLGVIEAGDKADEMEWIVESLTNAHAQNPQKTIRILDNYMQTSGFTPTKTNTIQNKEETTSTNYRPVSNTPTTTQGFNMEKTYKSIFPNHPVKFNTAQTRQVKQLLSNGKAVKRKSSYSGGYDGMSIGSSSTEVLQFCSNGVFSQSISSEMSGGGNGVSVSDRGGDSLIGYWDIVEVSGNTVVALYFDTPEYKNSASKGFVPMTIVSVASDHVSLTLGDGDILDFRLHPQAASCR